MSERTGQFDPSRTPGQVGATPPPAAPVIVTTRGDGTPVYGNTAAPVEYAAPLAPDLIAQQLERATRNERALPPLVFNDAGVPPATTAPAAQPGIGAPGGGKTAWQHGGPPAATGNVMPAARSATQGAHGRPGVNIAAKAVPVLVGPDGQPVTSEPVAATPAVTDSAPDTPEAAPPPAIRPRVEGKFADVARAKLDERPRLARPAESNSMDPARGVPRGTLDPGKQVTGGFGDAAQAQYFPLDGTELRELVLAMFDKLVADLQNDLRFSIAAVYPRVAVQLELKVEGFVEDIGFGITRVLPPHRKTPVEIARERADEGVFIVSVTRAEMNAEGESIAPPNALREELGLPVPHKRAIDVPGGRMIVDVVNGAPGGGR